MTTIPSFKGAFVNHGRPRPPVYGIKVSSSNGVVRLQGIVDVFAEKMRAEDIAARVSGVTHIENNLTVSTDGRITDEDINFEVAEELRLAPPM